MNPDRRDALTRALPHAPSRRSALRGLGSGLLAAASLALTSGGSTARKKKKKAPQPKFAGGCQIDEPIGEIGTGSNGRIAWSFVATQSGTLHEIRVVIQKDAGTFGNWVVQLVPVFSGVPAHQPNWVFAAAAIDDGDVPVGQSTLKARFVGISILAGGAYAVVVTRSGGDFFNVPIAIETCPNGTGWRADDVGRFTAFVDDVDFTMSIFVV